MDSNSLAESFGRGKREPTVLHFLGATVRWLPLERMKLYSPLN